MVKLPGIRSYPKELIIGAAQYDIKFVKKIPFEKTDKVGLCDPGDLIIYIKQGQTKVELLSTTVHEVLHAFEEEHGIKLPHATVYKLEKAVVAFLLANF